jgi:hypothetical protein
VDSGAVLTSRSGNITLKANQQATPNSGDFAGVTINGSVQVTGTGTIAVQGQGGAGGVGDSGVLVSPSGSIIGGTGKVTVSGTAGPAAATTAGVVVFNTITATGGNIQVVGQGGGSGTTANAYGVEVAVNGQIIAGGAGSVTVQGTGGPAAGNGNYGVYLTALGNSSASPTITSSGGNVLVTGQGGGSATSANNYGVFVNVSGQITAGGAGTVTVQGTGGLTGGGADYGVAVSGSGSLGLIPTTQTAITSSDGNVQVTGQGGGSAFSGNNYGVYISNSGQVSAGGKGSVSVVGNGSNTAGGNNYGVYLIGAGRILTQFDPVPAAITSSGGNVQITGQGGDNPGSASTADHGILVADGSQVTSGGAGTVTLSGTAGKNASSSNGVYVSGGIVTSGGGNIQITGVAAGSSSSAVAVTGFVTAPARGANITVLGDTLQLSSGQVSAPTSTVTLGPVTSGTPISLGSPAAGSLGLASADLVAITAGTLQISTTSAGPITVTAPVALSAAKNISLISGGDIILGPGSLTTGGASLTLTPGGTSAVEPLAGAQLNTSAAAVSFAPGANLSIAINRATQYDQLNVAGQVNLTGANLRLVGSLVPALGQTFLIVNNQGNQPVVGTFNGLPEGATLANFLGSSLNATISYVGGDGNDVVLTVRQPPASPGATATTVVASASKLTYGQAVTLTATVTAASTPTGSVQFIDNSTGATLGAGTPTASTATSATWTYTTAPTQLEVTGTAADDIRALYVPTGSFLASMGALAGGINVAPALVTLSGLSADKKYDASTRASIDLTRPGVTLLGVIPGDDVKLGSNSVSAVFASKDVGTGIPVTISPQPLAGSRARDYVLIQPALTANITPAALTVSGTKVLDKVYDGTTNATLGPIGSLAGVLGGDNVTLSTTQATGTFLSADAGNNKAVLISGLTLAGTQASDYTLTQPTATANITPAPLTVTGIKASDKVADGTTLATLNTAGAALVGVLLGDDVALVTAAAKGAFATPGIGAAIPVTVSGLSLRGAKAGDYAVVPPKLTANITTTAGNVSDNGAGLLTIALAAGQALAIVTSGTSYTFTSNQNITPASLTNPANQATAFTGFGTATLTLTSAGLAQYKSGISVIDEAANASVTFNDSGSNVYASNFVVSLSNPAAGSVTFNGNSYFGPFNLQVNTTHTILVGRGATLASDTGNLTLLANQQAASTSGDFAGVTIDNATVASSSLGMVTIRGRGGDSGSAEYGVLIKNGGAVVGGSSTLTVAGTGGATPNGSAYGVYMTGASSTITSIGGDVQVTGVGGGSGNSSFNYGVYVSGGLLTAGGAGAVTVSGAGGSTSGFQATGPAVTGADYGVYVAGAPGVSAVISSGGGDVHVSGTGGGQSGGNNYGVYVSSGGQVSAGAVGSVTILGTGALPWRAAPTTLFMWTAPPARVASSHPPAARCTLPARHNGTGVSIAAGGQVTAGGAGSVVVSGTGDLYGVSLAGTGNNHGVITSSGGSVQVTGQGGYGLFVSPGGKVTAGGKGNVAVAGKGAGNPQTGVYGVFVGALPSSFTTQTSVITSSGGNVQVVGSAGGLNSAGVYVSTGGSITAINVGNVAVQGTDAASAGGPGGPGVLLSADPLNVFHATIASAGGNVQVTGQGGGYGVQLATLGQINAGAAGNVTVQGTGGTAQGFDFGVTMGGKSTVTTSGGNLLILGQGGTESGTSGQRNTGVDVADGSRVAAGGNGTVTIVGNSGTSSASGSQVGVLVEGSGTLVTSAGGNVQITGRANGSDSGTTNYGFQIGGGQVTAGGTGTVSLVGTASVPQAQNYGVYLTGGNLAVTSSGGNIQIAGVGDDATAGAIYVAALVSTPVAGGNIMLVGNTIQITPGASLNAGTHAVTLVPQTAGTQINLGGAGGPGTLGLDAKTLAAITAGTLQIGDAASGTITVSAPVVLSGPANLLLTTSGDIVFNSGSINTDGGKLTLTPGPAHLVQPLAGGVDATVAPATLAFAVGSTLGITINGTNLDSQYSQLNVLGGVNLSGVNLAVSGTLTPSVGQAFTIVPSATGPVTGIFNGLPEGSAIGNFLGSGLVAFISYQANGGSDVVLSVQKGAGTATTVTASTSSATYGQAVTFTATVTAGTTPTGSVEFFDDTTGADLGAGVLQSAGGGAGTWVYATKPGQLQVGGAGPHTIRAVYQPAGAFASSSGVLTGGETITPLAITLTGSAATKVYDRTTGATLNLGGVSVNGLIGADTVTLDASAATAQFATKDVGGGIPLIVTGLKLSGARAPDYTIGQVLLTGNITPAPLTASGVTARDKTYDGTVRAVVSSTGATLAGVLPGDSITLVPTFTVGAFATKEAGANIPVTARLLLSGPQGADYVLIATTAANITPRTAAVSGVTASDKTYDGTPLASLNAAHAAVVGLLPGDSVFVAGVTGRFTSKDVGTKIQVAVTSITLNGPEALDYAPVLSQSPPKASITPAPLSVVKIVADKVYDGGIAATLTRGTAALAGLFSGDAVTLDTSVATAVFASKDVGTNVSVKLSGLKLGGAQAADYLVPVATAANITPAALTVLGVTANDKVYDASTHATLDTAHATLAGAVRGDDVTLDTTGATGVLASKDVGSHVSVAVTGLALRGAAAPDYTLSQPAATANITPALITAVGLAPNKTYDGTTQETLLLSSVQLVGLFSGDSVTLSAARSTGTFATKDAGTNIPITVPGLALSGPQAGDYTLAPVTGNILPAPLTVTGITASNKVADSTTAALLDTSNAALAGTIYPGDAVNLVTTAATGTFASAGVGNNIKVTVSGLSLSGPQAADYVIVPPTTTANIASVSGIVVSDSGTSALNIALNGAFLTVVSNGASVRFTSNTKFIASNLSHQAANFVGLGTNTLTLTAAGITQYVTGINFTDSGGGSNALNFLDSGANAYSNNLNINIQEPITFAGNTSLGAFNLQVATTQTIQVNSGAAVTSTSGNLTFLGNTQTPTSRGDRGNFVGVSISGLIQSTGSGLVTVKGNGGIPGPNDQDGVDVMNGGMISGGTGTVLVQGKGGLGSAGSATSSTGLVAGTSFGVYVAGTITSGGGAVQVLGQGGTSTFSSTGVFVGAGGLVTAGGTGSVTVRGTAGASSVFSSNIGVYVGAVYFLVARGGSTAAIRSGGGDVQVIGQGGDSALGPTKADLGVNIDSGGTVAATGAGNLLVQGTSGGSAPGNDFGVYAATAIPDGLGHVYAAGAITTGGGDITVQGDGVALTSALFLAGQLSTAPTSGSVTLSGDSMQLGGPINVANSLSLLPQTAGTPVNLGTAASGALALTNDELQQITAGTLQVGNATSGATTVSANISLPKTTNVNLTSGGDIVLGPGALDTHGGALTLAPGATGSVRPIAPGADAKTAPGTLAFASGATLAVALDGTTVDSQYTQLNVAGDVNLTGANLVLSGSLPPLTGQAFTIVNDNGSHAIIGTFKNLPEGAVIKNFLGSHHDAAITYAGGDGNDVVLTVLQGAANAAETRTSVATSAPAATYGQAVTFTAVVQAASGVPAGSVEFFDRTTGTDLGAAVLQNSGANTATWTYTTKPTQLQVTKDADVIEAVYSPTASFYSSSGTLSGGQKMLPLQVTLSGVTAGDKPFDGTTIATLNTAGATLVGVLSGDAVTLNATGASATFASKTIGNAIKVTVSGLTLAGPQAGDYILVQPILSANITSALPLAASDAYSVNANHPLIVYPLPAISSLTVHSPPGDFVGQGADYSYTQADTAFKVPPAVTDPTRVTINAGGWTLAFAAAKGSVLAPGTYTPSADPNGPSLGVNFDSRGFSTNKGQFTIYGVAFDASGNLVSFDASFLHNGEAGTGNLTGEIRYNAPPLSGVLANDSDVADNHLTAVLVSGPAHGSLTFNSDGTFAYQPNADFVGQDSFTYKANNGAADSKNATVTLNVIPVPTFAKVTSSSPVVRTGAPVTITATVTATGIPTGKVEFFDDTTGTDLGTGVLQGSHASTAIWSFTTSVDQLQATGSHRIRAVYSSLGGFVGSSATVTENITPRVKPPTISSVSLLEGTSGLTSFTFYARLSAVPTQPLTFDVFTTDSSAHAGTNYIPIVAGVTAPNSVGTVTFAPGQVIQAITVYVIAGSVPLASGTKTFTVSLSDPADPTVALATATATVIPQPLL